MDCFSIRPAVSSAVGADAATQPEYYHRYDRSSTRAADRWVSNRSDGDAVFDRATAERGDVSVVAGILLSQTTARSKARLNSSSANLPIPQQLSRSLTLSLYCRFKVEGSSISSLLKSIGRHCCVINFPFVSMGVTAELRLNAQLNNR